MSQILSKVKYLTQNRAKHKVMHVYIQIHIHIVYMHNTEICTYMCIYMNICHYVSVYAQKHIKENYIQCEDGT